MIRATFLDLKKPATFLTASGKFPTLISCPIHFGNFEEIRGVEYRRSTNSRAA
jgi:hypothetical protein